MSWATKDNKEFTVTDRVKTVVRILRFKDSCLAAVSMKDPSAHDKTLVLADALISLLQSVSDESLFAVANTLDPPAILAVADTHAENQGIE